MSNLKPQTANCNLKNIYGDFALCSTGGRCIETVHFTRCRHSIASVTVHVELLQLLCHGTQGAWIHPPRAVEFFVGF